jgi:hypothetical protein
MSSSCATVDVGSYIIPGETLDFDGHYYIIDSKDDERGVAKIIKTVMSEKGIKISSGSKEDLPEGVNYTIEYGSQWQWDVTWYLLNFDFRVYNSESNLFIASAHSLRTSLERREPEHIVTETLNTLFNFGEMYEKNNQ